jgi:hypothetical protein
VAVGRLKARFCGQRLKPSPEIGEYLDGHSCADAAGVDQLTVIGVVAQQERSKMRT